MGVGVARVHQDKTVIGVEKGEAFLQAFQGAAQSGLALLHGQFGAAAFLDLASQFLGAFLDPLFKIVTGLTQGVLRPQPLADIAGVGEDIFVTFMVDERRGGFDGEDRAVLAAVFTERYAVTVDLQVIPPFPPFVAGAGRIDIGHGHVQQFFAAIAERLAGCIVDIDEPPVRIDGEEGVVGLLHRRFQKIELLHRIAVFGHVEQHGADRRSVAPVDQERPVVQPDFGPILADAPVDIVAWRVLALHAGQIITADAGNFLGRQGDFQAALLQEFVMAFEAEDVQERRVDVKRIEPAVHDDPLVGLFGQGAEPAFAFDQRLFAGQAAGNVLGEGEQEFLACVLHDRRPNLDRYGGTVFSSMTGIEADLAAAFEFFPEGVPVLVRRRAVAEIGKRHAQQFLLGITQMPAGGVVDI